MMSKTAEAALKARMETMLDRAEAHGPARRPGADL
jgi:hypothetical protein